MWIALISSRTAWPTPAQLEEHPGAGAGAGSGRRCPPGRGNPGAAALGQTAGTAGCPVRPGPSRPVPLPGPVRRQRAPSVAVGARPRPRRAPGPAPPRGYGGSVGGRLPPRSARRGGSAGSGGTGRPTPGRGAAGRSPGRGGPGAAAPVRRLAAPPPGPGGRATRLPSRLASPAWRWKPSLQQTPSGSERNATARPAAFGPEAPVG